MAQQPADQTQSLAHKAAEAHRRMKANAGDDDAETSYGHILSTHWLGAACGSGELEELEFRDETDWFLNPNETAHHVMEDGTIWTATGTGDSDPDPGLDRALAAEIVRLAEDETLRRSFRKALLVSALTRATEQNMISWNLDADGTVYAHTKNQLMELKELGEDRLLRICPENRHSEPSLCLYAHSARIPGVKHLHQAANAVASRHTRIMRRILSTLGADPTGADSLSDTELTDHLIINLARNTRQRERKWVRVTDDAFTVYTTVLDRRTLLHLTETREPDPDDAGTGTAPGEESLTRQPRIRSLVLHMNINGMPAAITSWPQTGPDTYRPALPLLLSAIAEASQDRATRHLQLPPAGHSPPRDESMADFLGNIV